MTNSMPWLIAFGLLSLLALPGLYLVLQQSCTRVGAGLGLLLLALTGISLGWRLWTAPPPPAALSLPAAAGHFQRIRPEQLDSALAAARGRAVMLDFYADWCPSCQHWEKAVFAQPEVQQALAGVTLIQVDASDFNPAAQASLARFGLAGLPALISISPQGQELPALRLQGELSAPAFLIWLQNHFYPAMKGS